MGIGRRLKEAREKAGLTQEELARLVGVTGSAITNYEKETSHPKEPVMYALINALKIEPNFLFQDCVDIKGKKKAPSLSDEAVKLARDYDVMDSWGQRQVRMVADNELARYQETLARQQAEEEAAALEYDLPGPAENLIEIRFYPQRVSAGYGEWLDEMDSYTIQVPDTPTTRRADFCLKVEGDSMEPKYSNGDLVFVKKQDDVRVGEFGVWIVDGYAYLKKRGVDTLISINPNYDDIEQGEDVRCVGKVIGKM